MSEPIWDEKLRPLTEYLLKETRLKFVLTFDQIEQLVGTLPAHAKEDGWWWHNVTDPAKSRRPQRRAWMQTPYDTFARPAQGKVIFRRKKSKRSVA